MPSITVECGLLSKEQKFELIEKITKISSDIMHIPREFFFISINELPDENIGIGGQTIDVIKSKYKEGKP